MRSYLYLFCVVVSTFTIPESMHAQTKLIYTVAGIGVQGYTGDNGPGEACMVHWPESIAIDDSDDKYIADANNNVIRKLSVKTGIITTIAGTGFESGTGTGAFSGDGGQASAARFSYPSGVAVDHSGNIYIADQRNNRIRKIDATGLISTYAGNGFVGYSGDGGAATNAALYHPTRVALDASGNLFIADSGNNRIRKVSTSGTISLVAGNGSKAFTGDGGVATMAGLFNPMDMAVDATGNVFIADYVNNRIRKVDVSGIISTYAGNGLPGYAGDNAQATAANIYEPSSVIVDAAGNLYFSDLANFRVRKIDPTGIITTVAGNGMAAYGGDYGAATAASLQFPEGLALDSRGQLFIADKGNHRVRKVTSVLSVNDAGAQASLSLYPNPSNGTFMLHIASATDAQVQVLVTNVTGRKIAELTTVTNRDTPVTIGAPPGMYFLSATTGYGVLNEKVVVR